MASLLSFELHQPDTLPALLAELSRAPGARTLAGGTDLVPNLRRGLERPPLLLSLGRIAELQGMTPAADGLHLGAGLTLARLAADASIQRGWPALAQAAAAVAGPAHRSAATLGGNLCQDTRCVYYNQSPWWRAANHYCLKREGTVCHVAPQGDRCHAAFAGDLAPALMVLGAQVELMSTRGSRHMPLTALYREDGAAHLQLAHDELLARVHLPTPPPGSISAYRKAKVRGAMDFALAGVAIRLSHDRGLLTSLQFALTGTNSMPFVLEGTQALLGRAVDAAMLAELAKLVRKQVSPARSTVTPSNHRRVVAAVLAQRMLQELAAPAQ